MSQTAAIADRLESVLDRIEAALAAREAEKLRLQAIERAATTALAELDNLIGDADARDVTPARRAEHG